MWVASCLPENFDHLTNSCIEVTWIYREGLLPALSIEDAFILGSAVVGIWSLGFGFKLLRKFIFR